MRLQCGLLRDKKIEELRKAKEERQHLTEADQAPPHKHGRSIGEALGSMFRALNPFAMH